MPLENCFAATASHEEQHSLSTHRLASSRRAVESTKQRSLPFSFLSSCLSLSPAILFCLELSPFLSGATAIFSLHSRTQRRSVYSCDDTHSARWARVRESRARRMNSIYF